MSDGIHNRRKPQSNGKDSQNAAKDGLDDPETVEMMKRAKELEQEKAMKLQFNIDAVLNSSNSNTYIPFQSQLELTTTVLDVAPELYSIWNYRRRVLLTHLKDLQNTKDDKNANLKLIVELLVKELKYTQTLLKQYPKSYWLWNHRSWAMSGMNENAPWDRELLLVSKMLDMDARNFHGWDYRRYVVSKIMNLAKNKKLIKDNENLLLLSINPRSELDYTSIKIKQNFSNYSAWHYRSRLLATILFTEGKTAASPLYLSDLDWILEAISTLPSDQSPWLYLEFLLSDPPSSYYKSFFNNESLIFNLSEKLNESNHINEDHEPNPNLLLENPLSYKQRIESSESIFEVLVELWEIESLANIAKGIVSLLDIVKHLNGNLINKDENKIGWLTLNEFNEIRTKYLMEAIKIDPDRSGMYNALLKM